MFCKNCKYFSAPKQACAHPSALVACDFVTGSSTYARARDMRENPLWCSIHGRHYIDKNELKPCAKLPFVFCTTCRYFRDGACTHPSSPKQVDVVTGGDAYTSAHDMRKDIPGARGLCGSIGMFYEPIPVGK